MVSGTHRSQSAIYKQIRNRKQPTTDYEASSRNSAVTEYNDRGDIEVIKAGDVAELLQVSTWMVYELVKSGELPHFKVGRSVRFIKGEVVRWMLL
jgi:excisionase family DNA binding protein